MSQHSILGYFENDHDDLDAHMEKFRELKMGDFETAKVHFRKFKFGLQRHIRWEEEILFPIFETKTGMVDSGPTAVMRMEHRQILEALATLHEKVRAKNADSIAEEQCLLELLASHNAKEENILYPMLDQVMSPEDLKDVFSRMEQVENANEHVCCCCR